MVCGLNLWSDSPRRLCAAEAEAAGGKCGLCGPWHVLHGGARHIPHIGKHTGQYGSHQYSRHTHLLAQHYRKRNVNDGLGQRHDAEAFNQVGAYKADAADADKSIEVLNNLGEKAWAMGHIVDNAESVEGADEKIRVIFA